MILLLSILLAIPAWADTLEGVLSQVKDGDTVEVTDSKGRKHTFRLLGADAPEKGQPFYRESKQALQDRFEGKKVVVEWLRLQVCPPTGCVQLAKVLMRGEDLALRQIDRGFAWHDPNHVREQSTTDRTLYADASLTARNRRRGLWHGKVPIPPWEYAVKKNRPSKKKPKKKKSA